MEIPKDTKTFELTASTVWFDKDGILYSKPKPDALIIQSREEITKEMNKLKEIVNNKKVCLIAESNPKSPPPLKKDREFIANEISSITKAMAMVTNSPLSKMIANLFFAFMPPPYPVKMFTNEKDAKEWIKQYI